MVLRHIAGFLSFVLMFVLVFILTAVILGFFFPGFVGVWFSLSKGVQTNNWPGMVLGALAGAHSYGAALRHGKKKQADGPPTT